MSQQVLFPVHFNLFPGKLLCREITLQLYFAAKFSRKFTLSLYFPANNRKPTERLSFSAEIQWKKIGKGGISTLNLLIKCQLPYPLNYEAKIKNHNIFFNHQILNMG
jgi:hypothetical protein